MKILINRYIEKVEKKAKHTLGKEEQFDFLENKQGQK